jgi:hypothetical protein
MAFSFTSLMRTFRNAPQQVATDISGRKGDKPIEADEKSVA